jgi:hypothetical protein
MSVAEKDFIRQTFDIKGPFLKVVFGTERERQRARNSANATYLGGKVLNIYSYTTKKPAPPAPPNSPEGMFRFQYWKVKDADRFLVSPNSNGPDLPSLMEGLTVQENVPALLISNETGQTQLNNERFDHEMTL